MHDEDNYMFIGKNKKIDLTIKENKILKELIRNKGNVVTHEQLCQLLYNDIDYYIKECMKNKIYGLRKKLKGEVDIVTVRGIGYKVQIDAYYCPFCGRILKHDRGGT